MEKINKSQFMAEIIELGIASSMTLGDSYGDRYEWPNGSQYYQAGIGEGDRP